MIYTLGERRIETAGEDYYIAPDASVIGSVRFGAGASVWFNCVLRGDSDWINLGEGVNVQDGTIIHTDEGEPVSLGARVSVGHRALLHGCTIAESTLIANGAMVLDRVKVGRHCIIAAGALVTPGKVIPDGSVVMGSPGQIVREVNERDLKMIEFIAEHYRARIQQYKRDLKVDPRSSS
jgi:carbonic anhydrase/acetyltransferase-like protein (isoleucine patch superfamily)